MTPQIVFSASWSCPKTPLAPNNPTITPIVVATIPAVGFAVWVAISLAALGGGAIGAGVGGLTGALVGLGIPEYEAKRYEGKVKEGGVLISVHSENSDETKRAKTIFKEEGAHDISSTGEAHADVKAQDLSNRTATRVDEISPEEDLRNP